jgi:hypothetical protein
MRVMHQLREDPSVSFLPCRGVARYWAVAEQQQCTPFHLLALLWQAKAEVKGNQRNYEAEQETHMMKDIRCQLYMVLATRELFIILPVLIGPSSPPPWLTSAIAGATRSY